MTAVIETMKADMKARHAREASALGQLHAQELAAFEQFETQFRATLARSSPREILPEPPPAAVMPPPPSDPPVRARRAYTRRSSENSAVQQVRQALPELPPEIRVADVAAATGLPDRTIYPAMAALVTSGDLVKVSRGLWRLAGTVNLVHTDTIKVGSPPVTPPARTLERDVKVPESVLKASRDLFIGDPTPSADDGLPKDEERRDPPARRNHNVPPVAVIRSRLKELREKKHLTQCNIDRDPNADHVPELRGYLKDFDRMIAEWERKLKLAEQA